MKLEINIKINVRNNLVANLMSHKINNKKHCFSFSHFMGVSFDSLINFNFEIELIN